MEGYDFEKLAREIAVSRLGGLGDKAATVAGEMAHTMLVSALKSTATRQDPRLTIVAICRGLLSGLLLGNQPLVDPAISILKELVNVSHDVPVTPEDLMTWAMQGFAEIAVIAGPEAAQSMESAIAENFMGAEGVFNKACAAARQKGAA